MEKFNDLNDGFVFNGKSVADKEKANEIINSAGLSSSKKTKNISSKIKYQNQANTECDFYTDFPEEKSISEMTDADFMYKIDELCEPYYKKYLCAPVPNHTNINGYFTSQNKAAPCIQEKKSNTKIRILSLLSAIFGILFFIISLIDLQAIRCFRFIGDFSNLEVMLSLFGLEDNIYGLFLEVSGVMAYLPPIGILVSIVGSALLIITGIIGVFSGKRNIGLPIFSAITLLGSILIAVGLYFSKMVADITDLFISIGLIILFVGSIVTLVLGIICACKRRMAKAN